MDLFLEWNNAFYEKQKEDWQEKDGDNYELWFMYGRLGHFCTILTIGLSGELNACGWQFKEDTFNHIQYRKYQEFEELERLFSYAKLHCINATKEENVFYAQHLLRRFSGAFETWDYSFISAEQIVSVKKILKKMGRKIDKMLEKYVKYLEPERKFEDAE